MPRKPIKRHIAIQPMSRDHHHGLLVGWKIRTGLRYDVSPDRIFKYLTWFYENYQMTHFEEEEALLFPILGDDHEEVKQAKAEHKRINDFFKNDVVTEIDLIEFEKLLTAHIRFEERDLFNTIQDQASDAELQLLSDHLKDHNFVENREDEFWLAADMED